LAMIYPYARIIMYFRYEFSVANWTMKGLCDGLRDGMELLIFTFIALSMPYTLYVCEWWRFLPGSTVSFKDLDQATAVFVGCCGVIYRLLKFFNYQKYLTRKDSQMLPVVGKKV